MARKLRFEWEVPDELFDEQFREEAFLRQLKEDAVVRLFDRGRISSGYGASLLGMTRRDFLELLQKRGVPFVRYTQEDLRKDLQTMQEVEGELRKPDWKSLQDG
jgi:predicted HTH domain antitoxin